MFDFLKKKEEKLEEPAASPSFPPPPTGGTPVDFVISLRAQGLNNNQVIQTLQRQGYSQTQIYDAMSQAESRQAVNLQPGQQVQEQAPLIFPLFS